MFKDNTEIFYLPVNESRPEYGTIDRIIPESDMCYVKLHSGEKKIVSNSELVNKNYLVSNLTRLNKRAGSIPFVSSIIQSLENNELEEAIIIYRNTGLKIRKYHNINSLLSHTFGCQMHSMKHCQHPICKKQTLSR